MLSMAFQMARNPVGHLRVSHPPGRYIYRFPVEMAGIGDTVERKAFRQRVLGPDLRTGGPVVVPGFRVRAGAVADLPAGQHNVAVSLEMGGDSSLSWLASGCL